MTPRRGYWLGASFLLLIAAAGGLADRAPLRAAGPPVGLTTVGLRSHAFHPAARAARRLLPAHGAAYLSQVAGDAAAGTPPVAAVREEGRLRLVRAGDVLDGAVVAAIEPEGLTLRAADHTWVMPVATR